MKALRRCVAVLLLLSVIFLAGCTELKIKKLRDPSETTTPVKMDSSPDNLPEVDSLETEPAKTEPPEVDPIYGQWYMDMNFNEYIAYFLRGSLGDTMEAPDEDLYFTLNIEFKEPNIFKASLDVDWDSFEDYMYAFKPILKEYVFEMAADEGISQREFNEMCLEETGMNLDEYLDEMLEEGIEEAADSFSESAYQGYFRVEDGKLYTADTKSELEDPVASFIVSIEKDTLEMTAIELDEDEEEQLELYESVGLGFPWEFRRQYSF